jgi:hypothetical protein
MKWVFRILGSMVLLFIVLNLVQRFQDGRVVKPGTGETTTPDGRKETRGREEKTGPAERNNRDALNRNATSVSYSKHAKCRMGCRDISDAEVMDILKNGRINYQKSDMRGSPDPKYAIEGNTRDGQEVRIVFANSPRGIVVVTVIDLGREWKCDCK